MFIQIDPIFKELKLLRVLDISLKELGKFVNSCDNSQALLASRLHDLFHNLETTFANDFSPPFRHN